MSDTDTPFEIGLVMAGAISAGAYTAGVMDFLLQALDEWEKAKEDPETECLRHKVHIRVMSGASAGGMTAAVTAAQVNTEFEPATDLCENGLAPQRNALYSSWVEKIDISSLLQCEDLATSSLVRSILNSKIINDIAEEALSFTPLRKRRPYIDETMHIYMTLANLRGVPYKIAFQGNTAYGHEMAMHADNVHFIVSETACSEQGSVWLDPKNPGADNWRVLLKRSAVATGAFPIGLAPQILTRKSADYNEKKWKIPLERDERDNCICFSEKTIPPFWPEEFKNESDYEFISVDGGLMNNEPLELARMNLARGAGSNPRSPEKVNRALIMIDPFPVGDAVTKKEVEKYKDFDIIDVFLKMVSSLKEQARFKPGDLVLAQDENCYSRWLVAPVRDLTPSENAAFPIASGMLGGFGGFLSNVFRRHDFQLGRRNCQRFLSHHFLIPLEAAKENAVFSVHGAAELERLKVVLEDGKEYVPIIPLLGNCKAEVKKLNWQEIPSGRLEEIQAMIKKRVFAISRGIFESRLPSNFLGTLMSGLGTAIVYLFKGKITGVIISKIKEDLIRYGLLSSTNGT